MVHRILKDIDTSEATLIRKTILGEVLTDDRHQIVIVVLVPQFLHLLLELVKLKF